MKANASIRIGTGRTILEVSLDGATHLGQLATNLMVTPGHQLYLQQMIMDRTGNHPIAQQGLFAILHFAVVGIRFVLLLVPHKPMHQFAFSFSRTVLHHCPIDFMYVAHTEHLIQARKSLARLGKNDQATHRTVETMGDTNKHITRLLILLLQPGFHHLRKGGISGLVALHYLGGSLVHHDDVIVFVNYGHFGSWELGVTNYEC